MFTFTKKRFFIILGLSVVVWLVSALIQFIIGFHIKYSLFGDSSCQITGFPIANCIYDSYGKHISLIIQVVNILFWFIIINLFLGFFGKRQVGNKGGKK